MTEKRLKEIDLFVSLEVESPANQSVIRELRSFIDELLPVVRTRLKWGHHHEGCPRRERVRNICECGLDEARRIIEGLEKK